jgi:hypothetical protein
LHPEPVLIRTKSVDKEKVLVTIDLSDNSIVGLPFVIQLAAQRKPLLSFLHVNELFGQNLF